MGELDDAIAALAARQHGTYARRQLEAFHLDPEALTWRVRRGLSIRLAHDVFAVAGTPATWRRDVWAAHLEAGPTSCVGGWTAAHLLGLEDRPRPGIELVVPRQHDHRVALSSLRLSTRIPAAHVVHLDGLPCLSGARCVFDLAGDVPRSLRSPAGREVHALKVERLVDRALTRSVTTLGDLRAVLAVLGGRGRKGSAVLRQVLDARTVGYVPPESELESLFVQLCRSAGLPAAKRQVVVGGELVVGRVDFLFADERLVVELDGAAFHDGRAERERDRRRDNLLASLGLRVLRIRWRDLVDHPEATAALLRASLSVRPAA